MSVVGRASFRCGSIKAAKNAWPKCVGCGLRLQSAQVVDLTHTDLGRLSIHCVRCGRCILTLSRDTQWQPS